MLFDPDRRKEKHKTRDAKHRSGQRGRSKSVPADSGQSSPSASGTEEAVETDSQQEEEKESSQAQTARPEKESRGGRRQHGTLMARLKEKRNNRDRSSHKKRRETAETESSTEENGEAKESRRDRGRHRGKLRELFKGKKDGPPKEKKLNVPLGVRSKALQMLAQNFMGGRGIGPQATLPVLGMLAMNSQLVQNKIGNTMNNMLSSPSVQQAMTNMLRSMVGEVPMEGQEEPPTITVEATPSPESNPNPGPPPPSSSHEDIIARLRAFAEGNEGTPAGERGTAEKA